MKLFAWILCLSLGCLSVAGCGGNTGPDRGGPSEAARKQAGEADRVQRFKDLRDSGNKALEEKRFDDAIRDFEAAIPLQDDPQTRELLQQAQTAREAARKAAYDQAMLRGNQALQKKDYPAAVAAFREARSHQSDDKDAAAALQTAEFHDFLEKGQTALQNEQYADAVRAFGEAQKRRTLDKDSEEFLKQARAKRRQQVMFQGQAALKAMQYSEAVRFFTEAKDLAADAEVTALLTEANFQEKLQLGRQRFEAKQLTAAISALEAALVLKPDHAESRDLLQKATAEKKRLEAEYDRILNAGKSHLSSRRYDDAIREFRKAKSLLPERTEAGRFLSEAEGKKRDYERYMSNGKFAMQSRRYDDAIREFRDAERLAPFGSEAASLAREAEARKRQDAMKKR